MIGEKRIVQRMAKKKANIVMKAPAKKYFAEADSRTNLRPSREDDCGLGVSDFAT